MSYHEKIGNRSEDPSAWVELQNSTILTRNNPVGKRFKTQWGFQKVSSKGILERIETVQTHCSLSRMSAPLAMILESLCLNRESRENR